MIWYNREAPRFFPLLQLGKEKSLFRSNHFYVQVSLSVRGSSVALGRTLDLWKEHRDHSSVHSLREDEMRVGLFYVLPPSLHHRARCRFDH
jgi:hypothetical protein